MKKFLTLTIICLLLLTAGCSSGEGKVKVIEGAGSANNSLLVSLYELCPGTPEGFLADDNLLVSHKVNEYEFSSVNLVTKEKSVLTSMALEKDFYLEISPDGKKFISGSYLFNTEQKSKSFLRGENPLFPNPGKLPYPPSYAFSDENELLYINPFYYIKKYYNEDPKK